MKRAALVEQFETVLPEDGTVETPLEGITLFRLSHVVERLPGIYPPAACVVVQGEKRAYFDGRVHRYDASQYLCSAMPLPVEGEVREASPELPLLGLMVSFETQAMMEACLAYEAAISLSPEEPGPSDPEGFMTAPWDPPFSSAVANLLEALADPVLLQVTGQGRLRELLIAILRGAAGRLICGRKGPYRSLLNVIAHIRANLSSRLSVGELSGIAGMSRPVFHRHFKRATSLTPNQFVKTLRLNEGARMMAQGVAVGTTASQVGYVSASQFSREFKRQFGRAPHHWRSANSRKPPLDGGL